MDNNSENSETIYEIPRKDFEMLLSSKKQKYDKILETKLKTCAENEVLKKKLEIFESKKKTTHKDYEEILRTKNELILTKLKKTETEKKIPLTFQFSYDDDKNDNPRNDYQSCIDQETYQRRKKERELNEKSLFSSLRGITDKIQLKHGIKPLKILDD